MGEIQKSKKHRCFRYKNASLTQGRVNDLLCTHDAS